MLNVEIKMENYGKILKAIQPKLKVYMFKWAQEFKKDITDVEDVVYVSLEEAIKKFDKDRGKCSFINYFVTLARNRLINDVSSKYNKNIVLTNLRYNPCELCMKECERKCAKYKRYYQGLLNLNTEETRQARDFTLELLEQEHSREMLKRLLQHKPEHKFLIINIMKEIYNGKSGRKAIAGGIRRTIAKTKECRYWNYKHLRELKDCLLNIRTDLEMAT